MVFHTCYFAEIDPFVGRSIRTSRDSKRLRNELLLLGLYYDYVVIAPGSAFRHPVILPILESIGPIVQAQRIGMTAGLGVQTPQELVDDRIIRRANIFLNSPDPNDLSASLEPSPRSRRAHQRNRLLNVAQRWQKLLPNSWVLTRNIDDQVRHFSQLLDEGPQYNPKACRGILGPALDSFQASLDRPTIMRTVAQARFSHSPKAIAECLAFIQLVYLRMGIKHKALFDCQNKDALEVVIYAETFKNWLNSAGMPWIRTELPTLSEINLQSCRQYLTNAGLDLDLILEQHPMKLLKLTCHKDWPYARQLLSGLIDRSHCEAFKITLNESVGDPHTFRVSDLPVSSPVFSKTQFATHAILGSIQLFDKGETPRFLANQPEFSIHDRLAKKSVSLAPRQFYLICELAAAAGGPIELLEAAEMLHEIETLKRSLSPILSDCRDNLSDKDSGLPDSVRDSLYQLKRNLNMRLIEADINLRLALEKSAFFLKTKNDALVSDIELIPSMWKHPSKINVTSRPRTLRAKIKVALLEAGPAGLTTAALCRAVSGPKKEVDPRKVQSAISRMNQSKPVISLRGTKSARSYVHNRHLKKNLSQ